MAISFDTMAAREPTLRRAQGDSDAAAAARPLARAGSWVGLVVVLVGTFGLLGLLRQANFVGTDSRVLDYFTLQHPGAGPQFAQFGTDNTLNGLASVADDPGALTTGVYRPLSQLLMALQSGVFGHSYALWHLAAIALHMACAGLLYGIVLLVTRRPVAATIAGLAFAWQPIHETAVAELNNQPILWAGLFGLLAAFLYVLARDTHGRSPARLRAHLTDTFDYAPPPMGRSLPQRPLMIGAGVAFALALLCHETALALPLALAFYELVTAFFGGTRLNGGAAGRGNLAALGGLWAVLVVYLLARLIFFGGLGEFDASNGLNLRSFLGGVADLLFSPFTFGEGLERYALLALPLVFFFLTATQEWEMLFGVQTAEDDAARHTVKPVVEPEAVLETGETAIEAAATGEVSTPTIMPIETTADPASLPPETEEAAPIVAETEAEDAAPIPVWRYFPPLPLTATMVWGALWTLAFVLPLALRGAAEPLLYLASAGWAMLIGVAIAPLPAALVRVAGAAKNRISRWFDLGFVLRAAATAALLAVCFAATLDRINTRLLAASQQQALIESIRAQVPGLPPDGQLVIAAPTAGPLQATSILLAGDNLSAAIRMAYGAPALTVTVANQFPLVQQDVAQTVFVEVQNGRVVRRDDIARSLAARAASIENGGERSLETWDFTTAISAGDKTTYNGWTDTAHTASISYDPDHKGLVVTGGAAEATLESPRFNVSAIALGGVNVSYIAIAKVNTTTDGQIEWYGQPYGEPKARATTDFALQPDGQPHSVTVRPPDTANLTTTDSFALIRLIIPNSISAVTLQKITLTEIALDTPTS